MERALADSHASGTSTDRARYLILLLLTRLDAASGHIEGLNHAFQSDDADRVVMITMKLQSVWSDTHVAILVLEQLSGCTETHARNALTQSYKRAHSHWSWHEASPRAYPTTTGPSPVHRASRRRSLEHIMATCQLSHFCNDGTATTRYPPRKL
jgi:hypothetical protein